jgi:outer membrane receptor for monomeric catechols
MPSGLTRVATVALLLCCVREAPADVTVRSAAMAPDRAGAAHRSMNHVAQRHVRRGPRVAQATWYVRDGRRGLAPDRDPYADPKAPYKANRLSLSRATQPILNTPAGVTVLTRQVLDDKNATTLRDAMRTTAGVTLGR